MAQVVIAIIPAGVMVVVLAEADLAVEVDLAVVAECPAAAVPPAAGKEEWKVK